MFFPTLVQSSAISKAFRRLAAGVAVLAAVSLCGVVSPARAEGKISIAEQYGIAFLPLHVIRDQKLIEK